MRQYSPEARQIRVVATKSFSDGTLAELLDAQGRMYGRIFDKKGMRRLFFIGERFISFVRPDFEAKEANKTLK